MPPVHGLSRITGTGNRKLTHKRPFSFLCVFHQSKLFKTALPFFRPLFRQKKMTDAKPATAGAWATAKPFVNGGLSGMAATTIIQPIDMVKVRLQLGASGGPVSFFLPPFFPPRSTLSLEAEKKKKIQPLFSQNTRKNTTNCSSPPSVLRRGAVHQGIWRLGPLPRPFRGAPAPGHVHHGPPRDLQLAVRGPQGAHAQRRAAAPVPEGRCGARRRGPGSPGGLPRRPVADPDAGGLDAARRAAPQLQGRRRRADAHRPRGRGRRALPGRRPHGGAGDGAQHGHAGVQRPGQGDAAGGRVRRADGRDGR